MKIEENLKSIREVQGKSHKFVADALGISESDYKLYEIDAEKLTVAQLKTISSALSCSMTDLVEEGNAIGQIKNYFYNHADNKGTNIKIQGIDQEEIRKSYKELYQEELNRIPKLEKLLRDNNIVFNY
ncbi:MAG: helix-turn-helix transcriptional regulator [Chitinophagaceae bacterium]|nr:helix-turn-helix transcriptional regulator [Chitinophagaceae bacterium]